MIARVQMTFFHWRLTEIHWRPRLLYFYHWYMWPLILEVSVVESNILSRQSKWMGFHWIKQFTVQILVLSPWNSHPPICQMLIINTDGRQNVMSGSEFYTGYVESIRLRASNPKLEFHALTTFWDYFHLDGVTLIPVRICNYIHYKVYDDIIYPFPNFNCAAVEVWESIIDVI